MNRKTHTATLSAALKKLLICLVVIIAAWVAMIIDIKLTGASTAGDSELFRNASIAALVLGGFGFIALTSLFAEAFGKNKLLFCSYCFLFPIGPIAVYFYFRSRIVQLKNTPSPRNEA